MRSLSPAIANHFFSRSLCECDEAESITIKALNGCDDGELFLEHTLSEIVSFRNSVLHQSSYDLSHGFGLRGVRGESAAFAFGSTITPATLRQASDTLHAIHHLPSASSSWKANLDDKAPTALYAPINPALGYERADRIALLATIDAYIREANPLVCHINISIATSHQEIALFRPLEGWHEDSRPLVRLSIDITVEKNGRREEGYAGIGGRYPLSRLLSDIEWKSCADRALKQAITNLSSVPAPAGELPVILSNAWPGIILHEAIGHGLEGDFNRKKTSAFHHRMGTQVASKGVTIVDDGTLPERRGSLTIDDEGTPTQNTCLIDDGILIGYMHDRTSARLMGMNLTGNGRRESYSSPPLPRMTNTYMQNGTASPESLIASVKDGIFAVSFRGGQVDITSGKFVFSANEAYRVTNGVIGAPIKGATLIGDGPSILTRIQGVGNDLALDTGIGICGKDGQSVPVGVGQPTIFIDRMTVGGTE